MSEEENGGIELADDFKMTFVDAKTGEESEMKQDEEGKWGTEKEKKSSQGDAHFSVNNCEEGCDNCGIVGDFGVTYKPKNRPEKELVLCEKCSVGIVICFNNAGMLG